MTASGAGLHRSSHHGYSDAGPHTRSLSVATRNFLSLGTPRPVDGRQRLAGLLARGLESCITFPDSVYPVVYRCRHAAYSCGGSPGIEPGSHLNPVRELDAAHTLPEKREAVKCEMRNCRSAISQCQCRRQCRGATLARRKACAAENLRTATSREYPAEQR